MEEARRYIQLTHDQSQSVSRLVIPAHEVGVSSSFYEDFALEGIQVRGLYFRGPSSLDCANVIYAADHMFVCLIQMYDCNLGLLNLDRDGKLANGAIANLVDVVGGPVVHVEGLPLCVSVDISIAFLSRN